MAASVTDAFRRCRRDAVAFARSGERRTIVEAAVFLILVRIGLWTLPFRAVRAAIDRIPRLSHAPQIDSPFDVGRIVDAVGRRLPMPITCLVEALAAKAMLRHRGRQATLHFGVRNGEIARRTLNAHAWLVCEGQVVVGRFDDAEGYLTLESVRETGSAT